MLQSDATKERSKKKHKKKMLMMVLIIRNIFPQPIFHFRAYPKVDLNPGVVQFPQKGELGLSLPVSKSGTLISA